ncbi:unnamed protein product [Lactuca saligna]|uniref:Uncharacterized protein n=1 Tax=Lactuca saligna TaxID=75948 RepID=A0AA35UV15_LACSI|nr:unnamed protein product [Lactuca saligna]
MGWAWKEEHLDIILVPSGFLIMCVYHLFLLYRYLKHPETTAIGYENHNKKAWVEKMLLIDTKDRGFVVSVLNSHLSASTSLCSISLLLCSLIGALLGNSSNNFLTSTFIFGDTSSVPVLCIQKSVIRGNNFWTVGLRALYFAITLLLWIFGPIPMCVGSVATVIILHFLDVNKAPMIEYGSHKGSNSDHLRKIGHEIASVVRPFEHNGRP